MSKKVSKSHASKISSKDLTKIRTGLRKAFGESSYKKDFMNKHRVKVERFLKSGKKHKVPYVKYKCQDCEELFSIKDINVDHIVKVGSFKSATDIEDFFFRIWTPHSNLQILCEECHLDKTATEKLQAKVDRKRSKDECAAPETLIGYPLKENNDLSDGEIMLAGFQRGEPCHRLIHIDVNISKLDGITKEIDQYKHLGLDVKEIQCVNIRELQDELDHDSNSSYSVETKSNEVFNISSLI